MIASRYPLLEKGSLGGLAFLLTLAPLVTSDSTSGEGLFITQAFLWMLLATYHFGLAAVSRRRIQIDPLTDGALVAYLVWTVLSTWQVAGQGDQRAAVNGFWQTAAFATAFWLMRDIVGTQPSRRGALVGLLLAIAASVALHGLYQYFVVFPATRAAFRADPESFIRNAGFPFALDSLEGMALAARLQSPEPLAAFALTNSLAGYLVPWFVVAAASAWSTKKDEVVQRRHLIIMVFVLGVTLSLTNSRTAIFAAVLCLAIASIAWRAVFPLLARRIAVAAMVALFFGIVVLIWTDGFDLANAPASVLYRWQYWQSSAGMIADHPWFGVAPGNFQSVYPQYKLAEASETVSDPHNFLVEIAAVVGLPGLVLFLLWMIGIVRNMWYSKTDAASESNDIAARSLWGGALFAVAIAPLYAATAGFGIDWLGPLPISLLYGVACLMWGYSRLRTLPLPKYAIPLAFAAGCINLLAAGGIGFPSVAIPLMVLPALAVPAANNSTRTLPSTFVAVLFSLLAVGCYFTCFRPVMESRRLVASTELMLSDYFGKPAQERFQEAIDADRWSTDAASQVTLMYRHEILAGGTRPTTAMIAGFEHSAAQWLAADRRNVNAHRQIAEGWLAVARGEKDGVARQRAVELYRRAVELAPTSNVVRADLAWALSLTELSEEARREAQAALDLDARNPHRDKKLEYVKLSEYQADARHAGRRMDEVMREIAGAKP